MKKFIVTTTINPPTNATKAFSRLREWHLIVVGDVQTPHHRYQDLNCTYLHPEDQAKKYPRLSEAIGWNSVQRRNIGFIEAFHRGADVIATVDDDNIPYKNWGTDLYIGQEVEVDSYDSAIDVFDPLSVTESNYLWHRGYPIEYLERRHEVTYRGKVKRKVLIQADLWDGDPDIDTLARIVHRPNVKFDEIKGPFCSGQLSPFNSQNTFLAREVVPFYAVYPFVGRMDDVWGGYFTQFLFPNSLIYNRASVYQARNPQNIITNLENEIIGYRETLKLIRRWRQEPLTPMSVPVGVPDRTLEFYKIYRQHFA